MASIAQFILNKWKVLGTNQLATVITKEEVEPIKNLVLYCILFQIATRLDSHDPEHPNLHQTSLQILANLANLQYLSSKAGSKHPVPKVRRLVRWRKL
jgi:hypothetical protein